MSADPYGRPGSDWRRNADASVNEPADSRKLEAPFAVASKNRGFASLRDVVESGYPLFRQCHGVSLRGVSCSELDVRQRAGLKSRQPVKQERRSDEPTSANGRSRPVQGTSTADRGELSALLVRLRDEVDAFLSEAGTFARKSRVRSRWRWATTDPADAQPRRQIRRGAT